MELTRAPLLNTQLDTRTVWYDGDTSFKSSDIANVITKYDVRYVDEITPDIAAYNNLVGVDRSIRVKTSCRPLSLDWDIPEQYLSLDVDEYMIEKHTQRYGSTGRDVHQRLERLISELDVYYKRGLYDMLRTIIYVINTLSYHDIVWGIGRGSSVSSYVLYVIGVHDVDSFEYELDIDDFLHD